MMAGSGRAVDLMTWRQPWNWLGRGRRWSQRRCDHRGQWIHWALPGPAPRTPDCTAVAIARWQYVDSPNPEHWNYACSFHLPTASDKVRTRATGGR